MVDTQPINVGQRIDAAIDYANSTNDAEVRPHYLATLQRLTEEVRLADLTTGELIALKSLLIPAHSRVLTGRRRPETGAPIGKVLRIVPGAAG
jgi:hypothetical protein